MLRLEHFSGPSYAARLRRHRAESWGLLCALRFFSGIRMEILRLTVGAAELTSSRLQSSPRVWRKHRAENRSSGSRGGRSYEPGGAEAFLFVACLES